MNPQIGQVWRWHHEDEDYQLYSWDDLWLMLANDFPNDLAFLAIELNSGEVTSVIPAYTPEDWERVM